jgi:integrase
MFARMRVRLTLLYIGLFALVLGVFSTVFYAGVATALAPTFDIAPELTNEQAAEVAYHATVDQIRIALVAADLAVIVLVGGAAWVLATRTLQPIGEAHARQRRFVADASHEMRTPLVAIRASAEGALAAPGSEAELRRALAVVVESADRLARLTNDLLLLARADELPPDRRGEPVDLSVLVAETVEAFAAAHPELPRPKVTLAPDLPVSADPVSANTVSTYVRPLRSLVIWLVDEGILTANPFRRSRRRAALNPLLPSEETPTKSATLDDLRALERGCAGDAPLDLRDRAVVSVLMTTAARNSSVRLLRIGDIDIAREVILFRRAKGGKTLEIALHPATRDAVLAYLERGRPGLVALLTAHGEPDPGWLFVSTCGDQGGAAAADERDLADAHPPLPRGWWDAPLLRVPPDPPCHGDPARQQRDAARRGQPVPRALLYRCHEAVCAPDPRCPWATGRRRPPAGWGDVELSRCRAVRSEGRVELDAR